ncbi:MAG: hypothetical protein LUE86_08550 [Clostridiales bacterium]|nr:hypothetical protein [Clostridiales bacterium]
MEELRRLYEERRMAELEQMCGEMEQADAEEAEPYVYDACAKAARSHFLRPSLEQGISLYQRALELCGDDPDRRRWCTELFAGEVDACAEKMKSSFARIMETEEAVNGYRDMMRLCAEAYLAIKNSCGGQEKERFLTAAKAAADCMVELCAARVVEKDLGKAIVRRTLPVPDDIRVCYVAKYDELTREIRMLEPGYEPAEIQREQTLSTETRKPDGKQEGEDDDLNGELKMDSGASGGRYQNRFLERLKELFGRS